MVNYMCKAGSWELGCGSKVRKKQMRCQLHAQWLFRQHVWMNRTILPYTELLFVKAQIQAIIYYYNLSCVIDFQKRSYCYCWYMAVYLKDLVNSLNLICWVLLHAWCVYLPIGGLNQQLCQDLLHTCAF